MSPFLAGLVAVLALAALGMPLFAVIAAIVLLGLWLGGAEPMVVAVDFYRLGDMPGLVAIPLFTLAGYLLGESGAPKRLVRLSDALLGWMPGGLAIVALVACAFFTAFTGASGMTIVAIGALLYPALRAAGYPQRYSLGLVTSSGSLGLLFAPSLPLILFGFVAGQLQTDPVVTVEALFLAGILPGVLMVAVLSLHAIWVGRALPRTARRIDGRELRGALRDAAWEAPLPVVVLGGIYSGFFTAGEAAAVTALYVLVVTVGIKREIPLSKLPTVMAEAGRMVGTILIILGAALALSTWFVDQDVPARLFGLAREHIHTAAAFLLTLNLFLLLAGMTMDIFSAIVILTPLLLPVAAGYGIHPVHFGIVMLANLQIGYFLPPMGMDLFIASYRFRIGVLTLARACVPFFVLVGLCVLAIAWIPGLSLALL